MKNGKQDPLISIIVPVYQAGNYLRACLDSIVSQTYRQWELLLIDDGSMDAGGRICDEYAAADPRIHVFHQPNAGLSAARNTGLDNCSGAYITMVDADDVLLADDYLKVLYEALGPKQDAQMSMCGIIQFQDGGPIPKPDGDGKLLTDTSGKELCNHQGHGRRFWYGSAYAKLYARELFDGIRYPVGRLIEDDAIAHRLIFPCGMIRIADRRMYGYRQRKESIMHAGDMDRIMQDTIYAFCDRIDFFHAQGEPMLAKRAQQQMLIQLNYHKRRLREPEAQ